MKPWFPVNYLLTQLPVPLQILNGGTARVGQTLAASPENLIININGHLSDYAEVFFF